MRAAECGGAVDGRVTVLTRPTPIQQKAFDLLGLTV
jgi:hypothetical protein